MRSDKPGAEPTSFCPHCGKPLQLLLWGARRRLPNRRSNETNNLLWQGRNGAAKTWSYTLGFYLDGSIGELFVDAPRYDTAPKPLVESEQETAAKDAAVIASTAIQFGAPISTLADGMKRADDGSPASVIGAVLGLIAKRNREG
jgi:ribonucleoside-diphosphate reductase alpha chain